MKKNRFLMQKTPHFALFVLRHKALSLSLCAGVSLTLLSSGCDKGESDSQDRENETKGQDSDENKDQNSSDASNSSDSTEGVSKELIARVTKTCKTICESENARDCKEMGLDQEQDSCIDNCGGEISTFFTASKKKACLDSLDPTFSCLYTVQCEDFPDTFKKVIKLLDKDATFSGECSEEFDKSNEHCAEDFNEFFSQMPDDSTEPALPIVDIVMKGEKWTDTKATIKKNDKGVHKVVISTKSEMDCEDDETTLDSAITLSLEANSASATASVFFHHDQQVHVVENSHVSLGPETQGTRNLQIQSTSPDGKFAAIGTVAAKVCE